MTGSAFLESSNAPIVRLCEVGGRFLVFDWETAVLLRRSHNISGLLVGTIPQQPTQNIFLGLPIELRPEEVDMLVHLDVAHIVDATEAHLSGLSRLMTDRTTRGAYVKTVRRQKLAARKFLADKSAERSVSLPCRSRPPLVSRDVAETSEEALDTGFIPAPNRLVRAHDWTSGLTLASSNSLIPAVRTHVQRPRNVEGSLCRLLQRTGFFSTPGLRFGCQYSVYPGDPLRFHAHFMANEFEWDRSMSILDIVSGGRLATAVKKSFLLGGLRPCPPTFSVSTFSIEWAAM
ncbi:hypothetical protein CDD83_3104 [Cordyceps sp. RAO-2017]|nr:hypothetical protein CDD83_3104 [Cordyceps sp. RAO-2017]